MHLVWQLLSFMNERHHLGLSAHMPLDVSGIDENTFNHMRRNQGFGADETPANDLPGNGVTYIAPLTQPQPLPSRAAGALGKVKV